MSIVHEKVTITDDGASTGVVVIHLARELDGGLDMSTTFACERANAAWLADELDKALDAWGYPRTEVRHGIDSFAVFGGGTDSNPVVNVRNTRPDDAEVRPGYSTLAMSQATTSELRDLLRALA